MKKRWVALAVAMLLIAAVASALAGDPTEVDVTVTYGQSEARSMLAMINEFRASEDAWYWDTDNTTKIVCDNLQPLVYDYDLEAAAMQRAAEVALTFQHTRPDGTSCFTAFPTISAAGENIAAGYGSAQSAYVGWREDDLNYSGQGHRRNMLSSNFNAIGIGHVIYNGYHYWTQALGYRSSPTTADPGAANSAKAVTVAISWSNVTAVIAEDVTLEFGASAAYPEVSYQVSGAWPAGNSVVYVAHNAADQLAWTAADPTVLTLGETQAVAQNAGQTTLKTTVFGQEVTSSVTVNPKNLSGATVTPAATGLVYTGIPQTPEVTVQLGTQTLTKDQDYTVSWANNTAATAAANAVFSLFNEDRKSTRLNSSH